MQLHDAVRHHDDANVIAQSATQWYAITAAIIVIIFGIFALLAVCAFRCYHHRFNSSERNQDSFVGVQIGRKNQPSSMMANAFSPKIVAAPFVRPDVEYCSPQYDRMSSCPADIEHVNGFGSSRGGGRVCSSASWSGDMGGRKSKTKDRAAGIRVDVAGGDATTPISDEELDVSVEDSITSSSSGIPACKMLEDGSRGAVNQNGSSVNEDLNGNNKSATETNNNDDNNKCSNNQLLQTDGNLNSVIAANGLDNRQKLPVIQFSVTYDRSRTTLIISITDVTDLPQLPITSTSSAATHVAISSGHGRYSRLDPYVRLGLMLPDGRRFKAKTRVVRASTVADHGYAVAPKVEFGETFAFRGVDVAQLTGGGARLHLAALAFDRFSRDAIIGECSVPFDDPQLDEAVGGLSYSGGESTTARSRRQGRGGGGGQVTVTIRKELTMNSQQQQQQTGMTGFVRPPSGFVAVGGNIVAGKIAPPLSQQPRGELLVSVGFQPGAVNRLSIVVLKARNLPRHTDSGLQPRAMTDFYVKIFLLRNGRRTEKKQSRVVRTCTTTNTVVFNEAFYFDLPPSPIHRHHSRRATPTDTPHRRPQAHLADTSAEILLLDWNRSSKEDVVGSLQIGPFGRPSSLAPAAAAAVASSGGEGSMAAGGGSASVTSDGRDRLALWPSPQIAQNEVTTAMLLNAVDRDRQVAVWYKLSD